jgi:hypothetical protein
MLLAALVVIAAFGMPSLVSAQTGSGPTFDKLKSELVAATAADGRAIEVTATHSVFTVNVFNSKLNSGAAIRRETDAQLVAKTSENLPSTEISGRSTSSTVAAPPTVT